MSINRARRDDLRRSISRMEAIALELAYAGKEAYAAGQASVALKIAHEHTRVAALAERLKSVLAAAHTEGKDG